MVHKFTRSSRGIRREFSKTASTDPENRNNEHLLTVAECSVGNLPALTDREYLYARQVTTAFLDFLLEFLWGKVHGFIG